MDNLGKLLLIAGALIMLLGAFLLLGGRLHLGRLPGDIIIKRENFTIYFPLMTGILLSLVLTLLFSLYNRLR